MTSLGKQLWNSINDNRKQGIVDALMSGQTKLIVDGIEIVMKPLKRDTRKRMLKGAEKQADKIIKLLE